MSRSVRRQASSVLVIGALSLAAGAAGSPSLAPPVGLPFAPGTKAVLVAGPHENLVHECVRGASCNSLDFRPLNGRVAAAAAGQVQPVPAPCAPGLVVIKHTGGWYTGYYHLVHIRVHFPNRVYEGQWIGDIAPNENVAVPCGGSWSSPHVHFFLKHVLPGHTLGDPFQNTAPDVDLGGVVLRGWRIAKTAPTQGCMTYLRTRKCSPGDIVTNYPAHGGEGVLDAGSGAVGSLRLDRSTLHDVQAFAGKSDQGVKGGTFDERLFGSYDALGYDCVTKPTPGRIDLGGARTVHTFCRTVYYFKVKTVKHGALTLSAVWTGSPLFSSPAGTNPGTSQAEADRIEHTKAVGGCLTGIIVRGKAATFVMDNVGGHLAGTNVVGGTVGDLAFESTHSQVGLLFC
jgi:LasA protease